MASPVDSVPLKDGEKFPLQQLTVLAFCRLGEPIAFMSVIAYIYVYTQDVRKTEENAAFYAGLLVSAFAVAEVLTAMQWGIISDKYGRKPIVLFGLAGTLLSNIVFGLATNYWVALASRFLGGLLNGNVAVMQTMVAEMCKRPEHEPKAYSMIPFVWSVGSILGSAMGGFLARPADTWPTVFPKDGLFGQYPYLLPNLVSAVYLVFAVALGTTLLEETNEQARPMFWSKKSTLPDTTGEQTPLLSEGRTAPIKKDANQKIARKESMIGANEPVTAGTMLDMRRLSIATTDHDKPVITANGPDTTVDPDDRPPHKYTTEMVLLIIQLILMSYQSMAYGSLLPPFVVDEPLHKIGLDLRGGLGYTIRDVGTFMSFQGIAAMVIQTLIFPPFVARVGVWKSFVWNAILLCPISYIIVPFFTMLPKTLQPASICIDSIIQTFPQIIIYPCLLILLKNATPSNSMLGQVNGLAMAACSGARTIAPPLVGFIYSHGGSAAGWWSNGAIAILAALLIISMKRPRDTTSETTSDSAAE